MSGIPRVVVAGSPHHVTQRGNWGADVFRDDSDRLVYLAYLEKYLHSQQVQLLSYCLMTNHIHLILVPRTQKSLARLFHRLGTAYTAYFNRRHGLRGHLWQSRYFSSVLDEPYLWAALRYVETNPVKAGLVEKACDWAWSSAASHCGTRPDALLSPLPVDTRGANWAAFLASADPQHDLQFAVLRRQTRNGRPSGQDGFVAHVERLLRRRLAPLKRGRKPGNPADGKRANPAPGPGTASPSASSSRDATSPAKAAAPPSGAHLSCDAQPADSASAAQASLSASQRRTKM